MFSRCRGKLYFSLATLLSVSFTTIFGGCELMLLKMNSCKTLASGEPHVFTAKPEATFTESWKLMIPPPLPDTHTLPMALFSKATQGAKSPD